MSDSALPRVAAVAPCSFAFLQVVVETAAEADFGGIENIRSSLPAVDTPYTLPSTAVVCSVEADFGDSGGI